MLASSPRVHMSEHSTSFRVLFQGMLYLCPLQHYKDCGVWELYLNISYKFRGMVNFSKFPFLFSQQMHRDRTDIVVPPIHAWAKTCQPCCNNDLCQLPPPVLCSCHYEVSIKLVLKFACASESPGRLTKTETPPPTPPRVSDSIWDGAW